MTIYYLVRQTSIIASKNINLTIGYGFLKHRLNVQNHFMGSDYSNFRQFSKYSSNSKYSKNRIKAIKIGVVSVTVLITLYTGLYYSICNVISVALKKSGGK